MSIKTLLAGLFLVSCTSRPDLLPIPAPQASAPQAQQNGVKLWANTAMFTTAPIDLDVYVTGIGVDIDNTTDKPVLFRFDDVRLVDNLGRRTAPFFMPQRQELCMSTVASGTQETATGELVTSQDTSQQTASRGGHAFDSPNTKSCNYPPVNVQELRERMRQQPPKTRDLENKINGLPTSVFVRGVRRGELVGADVWYDKSGQPRPPPGDWREEVRFLGAPAELASHSLSEQVIAPRSRITGYMFFPALLDGTSKALLVWKPAGSKELFVPFALVERK